MAADTLAEQLSFGSSAEFAVPAVRLLALQRRIAKLDRIAGGGQTDGMRTLATQLRDQFKNGVFGYSIVDAVCVAAGFALLIASTAMKL